MQSFLFYSMVKGKEKVGSRDERCDITVGIKGDVERNDRNTLRFKN